MYRLGAQGCHVYGVVGSVSHLHSLSVRLVHTSRLSCAVCTLSQARKIVSVDKLYHTIKFNHACTFLYCKDESTRFRQQQLANWSNVFVLRQIKNRHNMQIDARHIFLGVSLGENVRLASILKMVHIYIRRVLRGEI